MRIAIDTLWERGDSKASSAVDYLVNLCKYLPEVGPQHEYYILVGNRSAHRFVDLTRSNMHLVNCLFSNDRRLLRILGQQSIVPVRLWSLGIDALFAAGNVCPLVGGYCRVLKINTLQHYHAPHMIGAAKSTYRKAAFAASARVADAIVANSSTTKQEICSLVGIEEKKVKTVWEAVDECFRPASPEERKLVRERFGLTKRYLLFSSTLWPYKNAHTLIRAFGSLVRQYHPDVELVIAGRVDELSYKAQLDSIVTEEALSGLVRFLGAVLNREMPALYSAAEMLVYPSLAETFGKPLVEAMRCDLPVIASRASCIPEILGGSGVLVDPNDINALANAMHQVLTDEAMRSDLIERGRKQGSKFSWPESALQTLEVIESTYRSWYQHRHSRQRPIRESTL